ncbi:MAG: low specificity L-threonine aldolase [Acidothermus cellulolyticus]|nr:low specificity L-threonine aldolase [Acidothermus cellulolyticus]
MTVRHDPNRRSFASDNCAGVHPEILDAIAEANGGHVMGYGDDPYTEAARQVFRTHFGDNAEVYFVLTGTGANVVGLQAMTRPWDAVICADTAHVNTDECGAPEKIGRLKLLTIPATDGKLTVDAIADRLIGRGDEHHAQPSVVSLTQATELGTVYTPAEIAAITDFAHARGLTVHMDGARLANAAAGLGVSLRTLTTDAGVDVVSFGGTKNGLAYGEALVVLNPDVVHGIPYLRKFSTQLASKMRFVAAQFLRLMETDLWRRNAVNANAMARRLAEKAAAIPGLRITRPVQANAVFAALPREVSERLQRKYPFYVWDERTGEVRWMCAFDTTEDDVDAFVAAIRAEFAAAAE